jgi:SAM-dependent methyltransferase
MSERTSPLYGTRYNRLWTYAVQLGLRQLAEGAHQVLGAFGCNPVTTARAIRGIPRFFRNAIDYQKLQPPKSFQLSIGNIFPVLSDFHGQAGTARGHYFHQDLWAARKIYARRPPHHYDIGSRIDGFVAHLLTFMEVHVIDILPLESSVRGLHFTQGDATNSSGWPGASIESLSCLHAAEHFGLGRYSDPVDPLAHEKLMAELQRVLAPGGFLYFSVPIGRERLTYNAYRVFSVETILRQFTKLALRSFSFVDDAGNLREDEEITSVPPELHYGCGLFEFCKD